MKRSTHAVAWVLLAVAALVLWPERWGGSMTYVVTTGDSMAPTWQAGDLAVLRSGDDYAVGDVAGFRSEELEGRIVMHRIVEEEDGVYRFQGDNNDFVDPDEVTDEQLVGRLLVRIPKVGLVADWLLKPVNLILVVAALYLLFADRRDRRTAAAPPAPSVGPPEQPPVRPAGPLLVHVDAFEIPESACVADVECAAELRQVAARYDRPVLRDRRTRTLYVCEGALVYRCTSRLRRRDEQQSVSPLPLPRSSAEADAVVHRLFGAG